MSEVAVTAESIVARIERLPVTSWHVRMRIIVGSATFFDAFDALTIAVVLPVLIGLWHMTPGQIGFLISSGYIGQLIGSIGLGWLAERYGRLRVLTWTVAIIAVLSLACAFAWDYNSLFAFRFIQGLGLGGEVPIAATYINEFAKAQRRGQFVLIYQTIFPVGILATSLLAVWVVPDLGWQWMFVSGALPAILAIYMRRAIPESPRWLASKGRLAEADRVLSEIEAQVSQNGAVPLPPLPLDMPRVVVAEASWRDLLGGMYLSRTLAVWVMWFCAAFVGYGITAWMPAIYRTVFKLPVQQALLYSVVSTVALLLSAIVCTLIIDRIGRRPAFVLGFFLAGLPLVVLWYLGAGMTLTAVVTLVTATSFFFAMLQLGLYLYNPEIYPTRMRALGTGIGSGWTRIGSIASPPIVGAVLSSAGLPGVFLVLGVVAFIGAATVLFFAVETRGRLLEELSP